MLNTTSSAKCVWINFDIFCGPHVLTILMGLGGGMPHRTFSNASVAFLHPSLARFWLLRCGTMWSFENCVGTKFGPSKSAALGLLDPLKAPFRGDYLGLSWVLRPAHGGQTRAVPGAQGVSVLRAWLRLSRAVFFSPALLPSRPCLVWRPLRVETPLVRTLAALCVVWPHAKFGGRGVWGRRTNALR